MTAPKRTVVRLHFAPVGRSGEPYPTWVRALRDVSGVYAIREGDELAYIGESHTGRLYQTLTRHWQTWRRDGIARRVTSHDPGVWYARDRCQAAAIVTPSDMALCIQDALIEYFSPRDNLVRATASIQACPPLRLHVTATPVVIADESTPF